MFLKTLVEMGGFELIHHWHGIDMLIVLECTLLATLCCLALAAIGRWVKRSRRLTVLSLVGALSFATAAFAANTTLGNLSASGAIAGGNLLYVVQTVGVGGVKATFTQVATFINSLFSGDATVSSGGVVTLKNTGPGATGPIGSTTVIPQITIDAQGRVTALGSATAAGTVSSVGTTCGLSGGTITTSGTVSGSETVNAQVGTTYALASTDCGKLVTISNAASVAVSIVQATTAGFTSGYYLDVQNKGAGTVTITPTVSTINGAASLALTTGQGVRIVSDGANYQIQSGIGGGSGSTGANPTATASDTAVNGTSPNFMRSDAAPAIQKASAAQFGVVEVDGTSIVATAGVISFNAPINAQVGTTYTVLSSDKGKVITLTNASAIAVTIPVASTFGSSFYTSFINEGAGLVTLTPTTSTIDGAASLTVKQGQSVDLITDGTNYFTLKGRPTNVAPADLVGLGTGVATALGTNLSAAGGVTSTIASGTSAMGTSAIASAACATVVTTAATNTATTDVVTASFNGDPTAVTGYIPATAGMLTIIAYPTSGNVNFKVCNNTSASITPGAITLNWRVVR